MSDVTPGGLVRGIDGGVTGSIVRELLARGVTWIVCGTDQIRAENVLRGSGPRACISTTPWSTVNHSEA